MKRMLVLIAFLLMVLSSINSQDIVSIGPLQGSWIQVQPITNNTIFMTLDNRGISYIQIDKHGEKEIYKIFRYQYLGVGSIRIGAIGYHYEYTDHVLTLTPLTEGMEIHRFLPLKEDLLTGYPSIGGL